MRQKTLAKLEKLEQAATPQAGQLPELPRPWDEMSEQEKTDFTNQFFI